MKKKKKYPLIKKSESIDYPGWFAVKVIRGVGMTWECEAVVRKNRTAQKIAKLLKEDK